MERVQTGIAPLDRKLGGGIPAGRTVLLSAPPDSQSELLLASIADQAETRYLTVERPGGSVERTLSQRPAPTAEVRSLDAMEPLTALASELRGQELPQVLVLDRMAPFERCDPDRYRAALSTVVQAADAAGTVVVMHGVSGARVPARRDLTTYMADVVFDLRPEFDGTDLTTRLFVPKFRGGRALTEPLVLELTERVVVDTSRDIA
jgi:KaiC/GvpD/RAD55 family RecA-like ATPase